MNNTDGLDKLLKNLKLTVTPANKMLIKKVMDSKIVDFCFIPNLGHRSIILYTEKEKKEDE